MDLSNPQEVAEAIVAIRSGDIESPAHRILVVNLLWSFHEQAKDGVFDNADLTEDEAARVLSELPSSYDEEKERSESPVPEDWRAVRDVRKLDAEARDQIAEWHHEDDLRPATIRELVKQRWDEEISRDTIYRYAEEADA